MRGGEQERRVPFAVRAQERRARRLGPLGERVGGQLLDHGGMTGGRSRMQSGSLVPDDGGRVRTTPEQRANGLETAVPRRQQQGQPATFLRVCARVQQQHAAVGEARPRRANERRLTTEITAEITRLGPGTSAVLGDECLGRRAADVEKQPQRRRLGRQR